MKINCTVYLIIFLTAAGLFCLSGCAAPGGSPAVLACDDVEAEAAICLPAGKPLSTVLPLKVCADGLDEHGNIIFADETLKLYLLSDSRIKAGSNGEISAAAAALIETLDISYQWGLGYISQLSGLEHFTALRVLKAQNQVIVKADLHKNKNLCELDLSGNYWLNQLELPQRSALLSLHLADCIALQSVDLSGAFKLISLDLSGCTGYTGPLNLEPLANLERLDLGQVPLASLDLYNNYALNYVNLKNMPLALNVKLSLRQEDRRQTGELEWYANDGFACLDIII